MTSDHSTLTDNDIISQEISQLKKDSPFSFAVSDARFKSE